MVWEGRSPGRTVTCGVADAHEEQSVVLLCQRERLWCPELPRYGVVHVSANLVASARWIVALCEWSAHIRASAFAQSVCELEFCVAFGRIRREAVRLHPCDFATDLEEERLVDCLASGQSVHAIATEGESSRGRKQAEGDKAVMSQNCQGG